MNKLMRFDPFNELEILQRQLLGDNWMSSTKGINFPTTDIYTNGDKELVIEAHMPNFDNNDIDVHEDNGFLIIQAEKHEKEEDKKRKYVVRESNSSFYRRIQLPDRADSGKIMAHLNDGLLKVVVPLMMIPKPKKIAIGSNKKLVSK